MQSTTKQTSYKDVLRELAALKQKMVKLEKESGSLKSTAKPLKFRVVTDQVARREILEFVRFRSGARTSDIIEALELDSTDCNQSFE